MGLLLVGLLVALGGCAPSMRFDPGEGVLARSDEAWQLAFTIRDRTRWQFEIPGVREAPQRYPFEYDALLYRVRTGRFGVHPESIIVLRAFPFPKKARAATRIYERDRILSDQIRAWLEAHDQEELAQRTDLYSFDGRTLTISPIDTSLGLEEPALGAAFVFGTDWVVMALFEVYPVSEDEPMSAKEVRKALQELGGLLVRIIAG